MKLLSHLQLFATPLTVAYKAPLSMEFSRQEYWSGLPFPSPGDTQGLFLLAGVSDEVLVPGLGTRAVGLQSLQGGGEIRTSGITSSCSQRIISSRVPIASPLAVPKKIVRLGLPFWSDPGEKCQPFC